MDREQLLHAAIQSIHAAGLDEGGWEGAVAEVLKFSRARAVTLDVFDVATLKHRAFHSAGMRPATRAEYLGLGLAVNARAVYAVARRPGLFSDADVFGGEDRIDRDPFYNEFLVHHDVRYMACGQVTRDRETATYLSLCRSPRQGPVEAEDIDNLGRLVPHVRQALEMSRRLKELHNEARSFASALEWLTEGTAVVGAGGRAAHANAAFAAIARSGDGLTVEAGLVTLASAEAQRNLTGALAQALRLGAGEATAAPADFVAPRPSGLPPYVLSLRPVFPSYEGLDAAARAILFVRDPLALQLPGSAVFAHVELTPAEIDLARALIAGVSPSVYARGRGISVNTVYTHLRRLKEKTGTGPLPKLIRRLNELHISIRPRRLDS